MSQNFFISFSSEELQTALGSEIFRAMLDAMPAAVVVLDAVSDQRGEISEFTYMFANKAATQMAGETLKGKRFFLNDDALLFNNIVSVVNSGKTEDFVYHYQADPQKWIHYNIRKFGDHVLLTYENITDRKLASLELKSEKQRFMAAQAISHTGSFEWDLVENKIYWSDEMYRIHGLQPQNETVTKNTVFNLIHPDDLGRIAKKIEAYSRTPGNEEIQYKLKLRDGAVRHVSGRFESFRGKNGKITHISGLVHDITEKRNKSDELRTMTSDLEKQSKGREKREASLEDYKRIIESSSSAVISVDRKGSITTWNPAAEKLYGYSAGEAIGRQVASLIVPEPNRQAVGETFEKLFSGENVPDFETTKKCRGGNEVEVSVNLVPQKDPSGKITGVVITSKDISETKKAQQELLRIKDELAQKAEDKYQTLFRTIDEGFCILELICDEKDNVIDFVYREYNDSFERLTGFKDAVGKTIREMMPEIEQFWMDTYARVAETGEPERLENYVQGLDKWYTLHVSRLGGPGSRLIAVLFDDISELKKKETTFSENRQLLEDEIGKRTLELSEINDFIEKVTNTIPDMIQIQDIKTNTLVYTNKDSEYLRKIFGVDAKDIRKAKDTERAKTIVHPDDLAKVMKYIEDRAKISGNDIIETELKLKNGQYVRSRSKIFKRDPDGNPTQILIITTDITEQKKSQQQEMKGKLKLDEQAQFIQGIAHASADILFVMNLSTKEIVYTNYAIAETLGYSAKQIKEMKNPVLDIMHEADLPKMLNHIDEMKTATDNEVREIEYRMKHVDGRIFWFRDRNTVFKRDENGTPIEKLGICQDITERKGDEEKIRLLNKALRERNKELQSVNNEMKTFTSIAAYDYRETLQTLYTNLEYIISRDAKNFSNTGKANLRKAQTAIQKMKLLTDDIVAFSRLQTMDTSQTAVNLNTVIDNALKELHEKVIQTGASVEKENLPEITGFPFLLDLLFYHLLDNAIKFRKPNENPHIRIVYHVSKDKHSGSDVHQISIADNGIGLAHEEASKVFEMFYRIHGNTHKGSGIGLAICKKIADLHGGTMAIESEPGKGTTVCCFFPIQ